jgi:uncharacterized protein (TIGR02118 family)
MITRFGMAPRKAGMDAAAFQAHWRTTHADVVLGMGGFKRYWQNHAVLRDGEPLLPWTGFDACAQFDGDSIADFDRAFSTEHYLSAVRGDEPNFLDTSRGGYMLCERIYADGRAQDDTIDETVRSCVRLMTFMRLTPMGSVAVLGEALRAPVRGGDAVGREAFLASIGGQRYSVFDAVEIQWFTHADAAEMYVRSAAARERRAQLAGLVRGTERLIARVHVVI